MRCGVTCSWCHCVIWETDPRWPFCWNCGHRADVPRVQCDCIACVRTYGLPRERFVVGER
jgi:hypothetical protein